MVCLVGCLDGLDPGRLRFHRIPADHAADLAGVRGAADRRRLRADSDLMDASRRRCGFGLARRPGRPQDPADDFDPGLFNLQLHRRVFAGTVLLVHLPRSARHLHGGRVARWRCLSDGKLADPLAWVHEWGLARLLGHRIRVVEPYLWSALRFYRLARYAVGRRAAGCHGLLRTPLRQGTRNLGRKSPAPARPEPRGARTAA